MIFLQEINHFIQQGYIKLMNCDQNEIYNVTKDFYLL